MNHIFQRATPFADVFTTLRQSLGGLVSLTPFAALALSPCPAPSTPDSKCGPLPIEYIVMVYATTVSTAYACSKLDPTNSKIYDRNLALFLTDNIEEINRAKSYERLDEMLQKATQTISEMPLEKLQEEFQKECKPLLNYSKEQPW